MKLPLIKGTRVDQEAEWRDAIPVNMTGFAQAVGDWTGYLRTADGLKLFANAEGIDRGGIWSDRDNEHFRVSGDKFITVSQFGDIADVGGVSIPGSNKVQFAASFNSTAFVANGDYYRWDGSTLTNLSRPAGAEPLIDMVWIDGYYVFADPENLWATEINDETAFIPNGRAGSDFTPDSIVAVDRTTDNKLIAFNRYSTERFYNNAGPQFPFARIPNAAIPIGIVGTNAKASIGDGAWVVFGGSKEYSPSFYLLTNSYQNIATKEIDSIIDTYSDFELINISIEFRDTRDQSLAICRLPRHTLVYDISLSKDLGSHIWYEWRSGDSPWRARNGVYDPRNVDNQASSWIYGDSEDGRLGKLDTTLSTQYGESVEWICKTPIVKVGGTVKQIELVTAPGHHAGDNDQYFVSSTKDGVLFGPEVPIGRGGPGDYQRRMIARRLGDYPNWFGLRVRGFSSNVTSITGVDAQ